MTSDFDVGLGAPYCKIHVVPFMTFLEITPMSDGNPLAHIACHDWAGTENDSTWSTSLN